MLTNPLTGDCIPQKIQKDSTALMDSGNSVALILLDLSAASNSTDHNILLIASSDVTLLLKTVDSYNRMHCFFLLFL